MIWRLAQCEADGMVFDLVQVQVSTQLGNHTQGYPHIHPPHVIMYVAIQS
jgi:hypothetical protein